MVSGSTHACRDSWPTAQRVHAYDRAWKLGQRQSHRAIRLAFCESR